MNNPFEGLSKAQIAKLFQLLGAHTFTYHKNDEIIPTIKNENIIGIILYGSAQIIHIEYNGNDIILEQLQENGVFGTGISATNTETYHITAKEDTRVAVIDYDKLLYPDNIKHSYYNVFLRNLFDIINEKFMNRNERIKILEQKQIRNKLLAFFEIEQKKTRLNYITLPFSFKDLADYIAVNRSSMFREIKNLKDEGFINVKGKKITLLYK